MCKCVGMEISGFPLGVDEINEIEVASLLPFSPLDYSEKLSLGNV